MRSALKTSLAGQIAAVELEIKSRAFERPTILSASESMYQIQRLKAVCATLELFQEFEDEVRALLTKAIEEKKNDKSVPGE